MGVGNWVAHDDLDTSLSLGDWVHSADYDLAAIEIDHSDMPNWVGTVWDFDRRYIFPSESGKYALGPASVSVLLMPRPLPGTMVLNARSESVLADGTLESEFPGEFFILGLGGGYGASGSPVFIEAADATLFAGMITGMSNIPGVGQAIAVLSAEAILNHFLVV
ncbi:MAG: hypothetical protein AAF567_24245 [Actinomycetota bacterium]